MSTSDTLVIFESELGWMAMIGRGPLLRQLVFGYLSPHQAVNALDRTLVEVACPGTWNSPLMRKLQDYSQGGRVEFLDVEIDLADRSQFRRRVYRLCRTIPFGQTITYGQLAARAGSPGAARAVGQSMATNRFPLIVPCHRVVSSGGGLGGFSGPDGIALKQRLLALETAGSKRCRPI